MFLEKNCEESYPRKTQSTKRVEQLDGNVIIVCKKISEKKTKIFIQKQERMSLYLTIFNFFFIFTSYIRCSEPLIIKTFEINYFMDIL